MGCSLFKEVFQFLDIANRIAKVTFTNVDRYPFAFDKLSENKVADLMCVEFCRQFLDVVFVLGTARPKPISKFWLSS